MHLKNIDRQGAMRIYNTVCHDAMRIQNRVRHDDMRIQIESAMKICVYKIQ